MNTPLRILHLEDSPRDAELIHSMLESEGLVFKVVHVKNKEEFETAISNSVFDVILSDFALPHYNGLTALDFARTKVPSVPFILVSGTVGEELAVQSLRTGATDYILKQKPARLVEAIRRALEEAQERAKRQSAEEALRKSEERFQFAVRATNDVIWDWDLQTNNFWRNENFNRAFGYRANEIEPGVESWITRLHPEDKDRVLSSLHALGEKGDDIWSDEYRFRRGDGTYAQIFDRGYVIHDTAGKPVRMIGAMMDITEKKKLEEQFLRSQRMDSIGALAGGIAHDLNNALVPILVGSELMRGNIQDKEEREHLIELISTSAQRCSQMVKQVLSFARGVRGQTGTVPLRHLMGEMEHIVASTFPKSITIRSKVPKDLWNVEGDATELHQVLMNLCVNARDAMPEGGELTLRAQNIPAASAPSTQKDYIRGAHVLISVTDTGSGIPPELLNRIFEPFFTTKAPDKGTGLGLSTVAVIVKRYGGLLQVASEAGKGTEFKISLPAAQSEKNDKTKSPQAILPTGHGELILVVDDEKSVLELAKTTLENYGYRVLTATNGMEAIICFGGHRNEIRLLVTDSDMPFMDGFAAIRSIQEVEPNIPILMASGSVDNPERLQHINTRNLMVLSKPYDVEQLINGVAAALRNSRPSGSEALSQEFNSHHANADAETLSAAEALAPCVH